MPIYAYRCADCGFARDVLQKVSDPVLTVCPACGKSEFKKQVTSAGFQLKGSGWYVTDFKGGPGNSSAPTADPQKKEADSGGTSPSESASPSAKSEAGPSSSDAATE